MKCKAVIFDFDYTLGDYTGGIMASVNHGLKKLGHEAGESEDIRKTIGLSLKEIFVCLTESWDQEETQRFNIYLKEKLNQVIVEHIRLYPAVGPTFEELRRQGYRIGTMATKYCYRIDQILGKFQTADLVDVIVGAEDAKAEKPNPEGPFYAMEQLGADREEVLYTGDSVVDVKVAVGAGVDFAGVSTGTMLFRDFELFNHICIVRDLAGLVNVLTQKK